MELIFAYQQWPYRETFRISRGDSVHSDLFVAWVRQDGVVGRGECGVLSQYGHTPDTLRLAFEAARDVIEREGTREAVSRRVRNSSVRNALDCALWDWECKSTGRSIWDLTGVARRAQVAVDLTISVNPLDKMCEDARRAAAAGYRLLKLKADAEDIVARVAAIREAVPAVQFVLDANESWSLDILAASSKDLAGLGVVLIEQPLHHSDDSDLEGFSGPIPICADESCCDLNDLPRLAGRYQAINIKLDKVGGLSPALELARAARKQGFKVMLGCGGASSLGAAPAYVVATLADFVDLDSPALLLEDRDHAMSYRDGQLEIFDRALWG